MSTQHSPGPLVRLPSGRVCGAEETGRGTVTPHPFGCQCPRCEPNKQARALTWDYVCMLEEQRGELLHALECCSDLLATLPLTTAQELYHHKRVEAVAQARAVRSVISCPE